MNAYTENYGSDPRYKLKIEPPKYYIHEHKGIVVCELQCSLPELPYKAKINKKYFNDSQWYGEFKVKASAKCGPEDNYIEDAGMKIAESKAMIKALDKARRVFEDYKDIIGKEWDKANTSIDFFEVTLGRECMHLEGLIR